MSEIALNRPPRKISDTAELACKLCGEIVYTETQISEVTEAGDTVHHRFVSGRFLQKTDADGSPKGPVIPMCICKDSHAQG